MNSVLVKLLLLTESSYGADVLNASESLLAQSEVRTRCLSVEMKKINLFILSKRRLAHYFIAV